MKCEGCYGKGTYEDYYPLGSDTVTCERCDGTGLSEQERKRQAAERAVDEAWERNR